jgi:hypothetical protein
MQSVALDCLKKCAWIGNRIPTAKDILPVVIMVVSLLSKVLRFYLSQPVALKKILPWVSSKIYKILHDYVTLPFILFREFAVLIPETTTVFTQGNDDVTLSESVLVAILNSLVQPHFS